jgi:hypothetical protein
VSSLFIGATMSGDEIDVARARGRPRFRDDYAHPDDSPASLIELNALYVDSDCWGREQETEIHHLT